MRVVANLSGLIALIVISLLIFSCSGSDLLDETHTRYQLSIVLTGGEGDAPNDLEVFQEADCDGDPTTNDPEPGLAGITGTVSITTAPDAPFVQIQRYQVEYIPQMSPLVGGGTALPPELLSTEILEKTVDVPSAKTTPVLLDNIMTIDTKENYVFQGGLATFAQGVYVVRVRLFGVDENNADVTFTVDTVVRLMDIDNC
jgi:hypothetical protein